MSDDKQEEEKKAPTVKLTQPAVTHEHEIVAVQCNLKDRTASYVLAGKVHAFAIDDKLEDALLARIEEHQADLAKPKAES